jgi:hypothetical protein
MYRYIVGLKKITGIHHPKEDDTFLRSLFRLPHNI